MQVKPSGGQTITSYDAWAAAVALAWEEREREERGTVMDFQQCPRGQVPDATAEIAALLQHTPAAATASDAAPAC